MSYEQFWDLYSDRAVWSFSGWRCLQCGDILDPLIVRNRLNQAIRGETGGTVLAGIPTA